RIEGIIDTVSRGTRIAAGYVAAHVIGLNEDVLMSRCGSGEIDPRSASGSAYALIYGSIAVARVRVASRFLLPRVQQTIPVRVLDGGADNRRSPAYASLLHAGRRDLSGYRGGVFHHRI